MTVKIKNLDDSIPYGLPVEPLGYGHTFYMGSGGSVQFMNNLAEIVYVAHAVASTKSPTLHMVPVTPAAIAGVQRSVL
jgi:hypothetical protein